MVLFLQFLSIKYPNFLRMFDLFLQGKNNRIQQIYPCGSVCLLNVFSYPLHPPATLGTAIFCVVSLFLLFFFCTFPLLKLFFESWFSTVLPHRTDKAALPWIWCSEYFDSLTGFNHPSGRTSVYVIGDPAPLGDQNRHRSSHLKSKVELE